MSLLRASQNFETVTGGASYLSVVFCFLVTGTFDCVFSLTLLEVGTAFLRLIVDMME